MDAVAEGPAVVGGIPAKGPVTPPPIAEAQAKVAKPKTKKATTAKKAEHPPFGVMIAAALKATHDGRKGTSKTAILKHITSAYKLDGLSDKQLLNCMRKALTNGVDSGAFTRKSGVGATGRFVLAHPPKKPKHDDKENVPVDGKAAEKPANKEATKSKRSAGGKADAKSKAATAPSTKKAAGATKRSAAVVDKKSTKVAKPVTGKTDTKAASKKTSATKPKSPKAPSKKATSKAPTKGAAAKDVGKKAAKSAPKKPTAKSARAKA